MAAMLPEKKTAAARVEWLPAERLGQFSLDPHLRPWLIGQGVLTSRLRAACAQRFAFRMVEQWTTLLEPPLQQALRTRDAAGLFREVEMRNGEALWVYAQSLFPDSTLTAHPWLAELGDSALGETLNDLSGVERSSYEFAWLPAEVPLAGRALQRAACGEPGVWARRARLSLRGAPLLVQELFLPGMGRG